MKLKIICINGVYLSYLHIFSLEIYYRNYYYGKCSNAVSKQYLQIVSNVGGSRRGWCVTLYWVKSSRSRCLNCVFNSPFPESKFFSAQCKFLLPLPHQLLEIGDFESLTSCCLIRWYGVLQVIFSLHCKLNV